MKKLAFPELSVVTRAVPVFSWKDLHEFRGQAQFLHGLESLLSTLIVAQTRYQGNRVAQPLNRRREIQGSAAQIFGMVKDVPEDLANRNNMQNIILSGPIAFEHSTRSREAG